MTYNSPSFLPLPKEVMKRIATEKDPFIYGNKDKLWREQGYWPAWWVSYPDVPAKPFVSAYRLRFFLEQVETLRLHVTADERYVLFLDGERVGRGPEKGDAFNWFFETYEVTLEPGEHTLVAQVWALGDCAPLSQMSVQHGFLLAAEAPFTETLSTGQAGWEAKLLNGYSFTKHRAAHLREFMPNIDGRAFPWGFEAGGGEDWKPVERLLPGLGRHIDWSFYKTHWLKPAPLPPMLEQPLKRGKVRYVGEVPGEEVSAESVTHETPAWQVDRGRHLTDELATWQAFWRGETTVTVPAQGSRRIIIDLEDYYCAYPSLTASGGRGARVRLHWSEALHTTDDLHDFRKGHRDEVDGKYFVGIGNSFVLDGGDSRNYTTLWWQAGRYLELTVASAEEAVTLERLELQETRYPFEAEGHFSASDKRYDTLVPILIRGVQASAHETYEDSPYYEQIMYAADTRIESLCTYMMTSDARLPRKALRMFDSSRLPVGLTQARYPCRASQIIPAFALWWVGLVSDYAHWRDDTAYVRRLMPGVRANIDAFTRYFDDNGLIRQVEGWNTLDWVPEWKAGMPPDPFWEPNGPTNWQYVYILDLVAKLEARLGEETLANYHSARAAEHAQRALAFWNDEQGLLADDLEKQHYSEHTQCFALLSGHLNQEQQERVTKGLLEEKGLARTTIYFSHYLLETFRLLGNAEAMQGRLEEWFELLELGFKTPREKPEPSRSDCHGWSAHPLYHFYASILGIRPASLGFQTVDIRPQLGTLTQVSGTLPHPKGFVELSVQRNGKQVSGSVTLPLGVSGRLYVNNVEVEVEGTVQF